MGKSKKPIQIDKRRASRLYLPISIYYNLPPAEQWLGPIGLTDISGGGLQFNNPEPIKTNSVITLKIDIPDGYNSIIFKSKVAWCQKSPSKNVCTIGVEFGKMSLGDRKRYVSYVCDKLLAKSLTNEGVIRLE